MACQDLYSCIPTSVCCSAVASLPYSGMSETTRVSREQGREWLSAAKQGDLSLLTTLLAGNQSLLHHQARHCWYPPCSCTITQCCSSFHSIIVQGSGIGHSATHWSAAKGYLECLQWLLKQGADINGLNAEDSTPLHAAAANGQQNIVQYLLDQPNMTRASHANFDCQYISMYAGCLCIFYTASLLLMHQLVCWVSVRQFGNTTTQPILLPSHLH